jgi:dipeptidyl aminopeptidase/acylaminoacyl peptidase
MNRSKHWTISLIALASLSLSCASKIQSPQGILPQLEPPVHDRPQVRRETAHADLLQHAESRFRGIYDRNEFRARPFQAEWLPDSSGYTVLESAPDAKEKVRTRYDVASGKRTVLDASQQQKQRRSGNLSPDGKRIVLAENGNLFVRDLDSDRKIPLTKSAPDGPVSSSQAVWSPDGKWIAFVQSDDSDVKLRSVLVPGDPSYPEVTKVRFARVGGTIPTLRVGVVDAQGKETRWLPIPMPAEGFYLGKVDWAGNSQELLIEKLSRFRSEREFLLADIRTGALKHIFHETNQAWVDGSYASNAGWIWIRDYQALVVLSEKDGWRHAYVYSRDGSNTLNAMFRKPEVYHVGIAVAPKPQPHLYNAWFQEIYMQTPEANPDGYRRAAPINFAEGLKGRLLIIHGTGESNTHIQITEGLVDRLIELGKRFDYMAYPHRDHGLREGRGTLVHLRLLMARYLVEHLTPGPQ